MSQAAIRKSLVARFHQGGAFQPWYEPGGRYVAIAKYPPSILHTSSWDLTHNLSSLVLSPRVRTFLVFRKLQEVTGAGEIGNRPPYRHLTLTGCLR
jgi:hypothetical protein